MLLKLEKCIPISHVTLETVPKYANIERPTSSQLYASVTRFFRNHSNILICCSRNIYYYYYQYLKQLSTFLFRILWWIERSKDQYLSEIKSFCNIIHYTIQKLLVSIYIYKYIYIGKEMIEINRLLLFSKDALNWSKLMKNTFKMLQKISISDKCCSSELSINQRNLKKILLCCFQHNNNNKKNYIYIYNYYYFYFFYLSSKSDY